MYLDMRMRQANLAVVQAAHPAPEGTTSIGKRDEWMMAALVSLLYWITQSRGLLRDI